MFSEKSFDDIGRIMTNGKNYILPSRKEEWDYLCFTSLKNHKARFILKEYIYRFIKVLSVEDADLTDIVKMLDDKVLPEREWNVVLTQVAKYSKRGYEFAKLAARSQNEKLFNELEEINKENQLSSKDNINSTSRK
jgi:transcriptional regulator CtsR